MKNTLKNSFSKLTILLLFFVIFSQVSMAEEEVPPLPMTVQGIALINETPAPSGTVIAAYLEGEKKEELSINTSSGSYCFWISGTSEDEGKTVTFTINGEKTGESISWESGKQVLSFKLSPDKKDNSVNVKTGSDVSSQSLKGDDESEIFTKNSEDNVFKSSVSEPNVEALKNTNPESENKETSESSEDSSKLKSTPDFQIIYAILGILLITFSFKPER